MTQPIIQRMNYHPDPREVNNSDRKVKARLDFILSKLDFKNQVVLDLGCSGGYFAFEIAKVAKRVVAIDGDPEVIKRNKALQLELDISNIDFICSPISAEAIAEVGEVDITLFLSVFHHMLTMSDAYDWNNGLNSDFLKKMLLTLHKFTSNLVFEIGEVNEGYEWCERMPVASASNENFVVQEVFGASYKNVDMYPGPVPVNILNKNIISKFGKAFSRDSKLVSILKRIFKFDSRDLRKIYVGKK